MRVLLSVCLSGLLTVTAFSQSSDKISQLVSTENYFSALAKEKGIRKAFLKVSDDHTIVFRPAPVSAISFYKDLFDSLGYLSWNPVFARISKSNDWGFTTGPYVYRKTPEDLPTGYGQYLSVWKKNSKGVWKLALDLGIAHKKPVKEPVFNFANPKNEVFMKQRSQSRLQQREDLVFSSDKLLSTIQKADNKIARNEFLADDSRLLFPGYEPFIGKSKIIDFCQKQGFKEISTPQKADRSYSGELAFTYGTSVFSKKGKNKNYHYVRIWEVQPNFKWNIILEAYTEAEESKE